MELRQAGKKVSEGFIALRLTPFGVVDSFRLEPWPYTFYLSILPNKIVSKGRETGREYDLKRPRYKVDIARGDKMIAQGETESFIRFEDNWSIHFFTPSDWALVEVVYDPFYFWLVLSLALLAGGGLLFPFSYFFAAGDK